MEDEGGLFYDGLGSASRFFYCAKATRQDRNEGCEHIPAGTIHWSAGSQNPGSFQGAGTSRESPNNHPTIKPTPLMRYLCRLVTPPGGEICDPFIGSGSTGKGAVLEGFGILGCDNDPHSIEIACARIEFARKQGFQPGLELDRLAA
jgi:site-specific DNA-methyltransferase (adenine-specific)